MYKRRIKYCLFAVSLMFSVWGLSACSSSQYFWMDNEDYDNTPQISTVEEAVTEKHEEPTVVPLAPSPEETSPYALPGDRYFPQFPITRPATGKKTIVVDPNIPAWAAYDAEGNLVKTGRASPGKDYCPDVGRPCRTVVGTFAIYSKGGADCKSSIFPLAKNGKKAGGAPMPYCMRFHGGFALHGSYEVVDYAASHGCVRMIPSSAGWLSQNFADIGTTVLVEPYKSKNKQAN